MKIYKKYLVEEIKSKLTNSAFGKVRTIEGWKNHKRLYIHKKGKMGYMVTTSPNISLDDMVLIDGEYWFGTLKKLHTALNKDK